MTSQTNRKIKTSAFVGAAGTGKSQRAQLVAGLLDADYIIDDGLVVHKGSVVCGKSAKSERNHVSAIRRALFEFDDHRAEVSSYFSRLDSASVMVIATSDGMACRILKKIGLPAPEKTVYIEDVATPQEIMRARRERYGKGQHVIPVSRVIVSRNFAGQLVGQLRVFWRSKNKREGEKTIVRPPFSFHGSVHVEPEAIEQLVSFVVERTPCVAAVKNVEVTAEDDGVVSVSVELTVMLDGRKIEDIARLAKKRAARSVMYFTGFDVKSIDIKITGVKL